MPNPNQDDVFDESRLLRLVELMKDHGLQEVELRNADQQIRIARASDTVISQPGVPVQVAPPVQPAAATPESADPPEGDNIVLVKSPMVGTYYSKPNPNATPFVKVGDHVEPDTTVCIIEAMKVFNEIPAEIRGKIVAILVEDEEPVEFGKPIFKVDTTG